jgi:hypothetical protein
MSKCPSENRADLASIQRAGPQFQLRWRRTKGALGACPAKVAWIFVWLLCVGTAVRETAEGASPRERKAGAGVSYFNDVVPDVPWSIQVVKVERSQTNLHLTPTLGRAARQGLSTLSQQLRALPPDLGTPVVAVNGDFYQTDGGTAAGDPRGLEIIGGELVSSPTGGASFWMDAANQPRLTNTISRFKVTWSGDETFSFGLNEARGASEAVLYTSRFGASTRARGGREFVLENSGDGPSLPLQIGQSYTLRIREIRDTGNTRLTSDVVVLSVGPGLAERVPELELGELIKLSTATVPDLRGATLALSGGPILVQGAKAQRVSSNKAGQRHPRTAFGWNEKYFFFVQVDGRQPDLSVGMTLRELAAYMVGLGCQEAMNLDGGASSTLWLNGRVMNSPSSGHERPIGNCLAVVRKGESAAVGGQ